MTKAQKELIREAYAKEVDGEGWRKRMERWLDSLIDPPMTIDGVKVSVGTRILWKWGSNPKRNGIYKVSAGPWTRQ